MDNVGKADKLDTVISMLREATVDIHQMREEQETYKELGILRKENEGVRKENARIKEEYALIKTNMEVLKERLVFLEKEKRKLNVVLTGIDIDFYQPEDLKSKMEEFIEHKLKVKTSVKTAIKLGSRTCLISFNQLDDKIKILKNKSKLRYIKKARIYMNEDYTLQERETQKQLRIIAKEEREGENS
ncbi:hypothetical protein MML48_2g00014220 [Holotrichia oblita]|uniref:Uncharacterized protein n=1 Tax=Holotrichia oblita TaxID=644536 RepID=A0ACB9TM64_HOLOL|nr:hypothetical protein MML48_2g00014220 [Holotrichia oblita]